MKQVHYKKIKKYLEEHNQEVCKFFNTLYKQRQKKNREFEKKFIKVSSNLKSVKKTDGII